MKKASLLTRAWIGMILCLLTLTYSPVFSAGGPTYSLSQMITDWQRAKEYTKEYLDAMPDNGMDYKPGADTRSFAEQMLHIASANFAFGAAASGKTNPYQGKDLEKMNDYKTKAALSKLVMESYDFMINALNSTSESKFGDKVNFFKFEMTREQAFNKAFEHQTHHRGQTTVYLRMKGVKPPAEKLF